MARWCQWQQNTTGTTEATQGYHAVPTAAEAGRSGNDEEDDQREKVGTVEADCKQIGRKYEAHWKLIVTRLKQTGDRFKKV